MTDKKLRMIFATTILLMGFTIGYPQSPAITLYDYQLLSSLADVQAISYTLQMQSEDPISPVFSARRSNTSPTLNLEFSKLGKSTQILDAFILTGISRVSYQQNMEIWKATVSKHREDFGLQPEINDYSQGIIAIWRFEETNSVLTVTYNYNDHRVAERLFWDLLSAVNKAKNNHY